MRLLPLTLALLIAPALLAQRTTLNGGLQVGLNHPVGDFADKTSNSGDYLGANEGVGLHVGGHLDLNFTPHHQVRFILNSNGFASKKQDTYFHGLYDGTRQNTFGVVQLGADYVFNATSPTRGGYFLVGLNLNRVKAKAEFSQFSDFEETQSGRVGLRVGGGYTFNRLFSLEGHLNSVSVEKEKLGYDAITWLAVSAVFRFGR